MVLRLSVVTALMAAFAFSFSALVQSQAREPGRAMVASAGCYSQGAVCVRPATAD